MAPPDTYPRAAFRLEAGASKFSEHDGRHTFRLNFATGQRIASHWMFKNLYVDLGGIEVDSQRQPVLLDHQFRVGASTKIELTDEGFIAEGVFLKNRHATELVDDAKNGFPFRCSCEIPPGSIEFVEEGATAEVNGAEVTGPATIWRQSTLNEITITATPADRHTKAEIFDSDGAELIAVKTTTTRFAAMAEEDVKKKDDEEEVAEDTTEELAADGDGEEEEEDKDKEEELAANVVPTPVPGEQLAADISEVLEVATSSQHQLAAELIRDMGAGKKDLAACFKALAMDPRRFAAQTRSELADASPDVVESTPGALAHKTPADAVAQFEAKCQQEWDANAAVQTEFGEFKFFKLYQEQTAAGGIR